MPAPPAAPTLSGQALTLQGTVAVASSLTAAQAVPSYFTGTIDGYSYAWSRCAADGSACATVPGVWTASYTLSVADVGYAIEERITGTNASARCR